MSALSTQSGVRSAVRIGIVDDHPLFRVGLEQALNQLEGLAVSWSVGSGEDASRCLSGSPVDAVLMDVTLKGAIDGVAAAAAINRDHPAVKVIMMSASVDDRVVLAALRARAVGYLAKDLRPEEFVRSVRALADPSTRAPLALVHNLLDRFRRRRGAVAAAELSHDGPQLLSPRETEILAYIRDGRTNREIASRLGISRPTVDKHVQQILKKLQARNRAHAATLGRHT